MSIRAKTKRRVAILLGGTLTIAVVLTALFLYLGHRRDAEAREHRRLGMAAAEDGRYAEALEHLKYWLGRHRDDVEALYQYAVARRNVPDPQARHILEPRDLFLAVLDLDPDHEQARRHLLEVYTVLGYETETIALADQILQDHPDDREALRAKATMQLRKDERAQAEQTVQRLVETAPDDLLGHALMLQLLRDRDADDQPPPTDGDRSTDQQTLDYARQTLDAHPDAPRFELLMAYAQALIGDPAASAEALDRAGEVTVDDFDFIGMLLGRLFAVGMLDEAMALLERHADPQRAQGLHQTLIRMLWEHERYDDLIARLEYLKPDDRRSVSALLAFKAAALIQNGQTDRARPLIDSLVARGERGNDAGALAWATVLSELARPRDGRSATAVASEATEAFKSALTSDPNNPYIRFMLGEAYRRLGENELALEQWRRVVERSPLWAAPRQRLAQTLLGMGRTQGAYEEARRAMVLVPREAHGNRAYLATVRATVIQAFDAYMRQRVAGGDVNPEHRQQYIAYLRSIQERAPGEALTLPILFRVLAAEAQRHRAEGRAERAEQLHQEAIEAVRSALANDQAVIPQQTIVQLANISRAYGLGLEDTLFSHMRAEYGVTAQLAYASALQQAVDGRPQEALERFEQAMAGAGGEDQPGWQAAHARLLEFLGRPEAADAWIALGDAHPDNLAVQRMLIDADSVETNRAFLGRTIERIRALTGEEGLVWRLARAKWLLIGDDEQAPQPRSNEELNRDAAEALELLRAVADQSPNLVSAKRLMAVAHLRLGNLSDAAAQLTAAAALEPQNITIQLELARVRVRQGNFDGALPLLERLVASDRVTPEQKYHTAVMLAELGRTDQAIEVLNGVRDSEATRVPVNLMLARLHARQGRVEMARDIYEQLVRTNATPLVIQAYAGFLDSVGRSDLARQALAVLDRAELAPGVREILLAEFHRRSGDVDVAAEQYRAAIAAVPDRTLPWYRLIDLYLDGGRADEAVAAIDEARSAHEDDEVIRLLYDNRRLIRMAASSDIWRPIAVSLLNNASNRQAALEVLRAIRDSMEQRDPAAALQRAQELTDRYPRFLALQMVMADLHQRAGQHERAAAIGARSMAAFPTEAEPAQRSFSALAALGRWNEALAAAMEWRRRSLDDPLAADVAIADSYVRLNQPRRALDQLTDRVVTYAMENPDRLPAVVNVYTAALIRDGQIQKAEDLLKPLLTRSSAWRLLWMAHAGNWVRDPQTTAAWLDRVEPVIPAEAAEERLALARHWQRLAARTGDEAHADHAERVLEALAERSDLDDAPTIATIAVMAYQMGRHDFAERQYRRALAAQPQEPDLSRIRNNLAYLLAETGGDLDEALRLARQATQANADLPTYLDTLAFVHQARAEYEQAIATLSRAVEIDANNPVWRINLGLAYVDSGDDEQARQQLDAIDRLVAGPDDLSEGDRQRLRQLRQRLAERQAAAP